MSCSRRAGRKQAKADKVLSRGGPRRDAKFQTFKELKLKLLELKLKLLELKLKLLELKLRLRLGGAAAESVFGVGVGEQKQKPPVFFCVAFFFAPRFFLRRVFFCAAVFFAPRFFLRRGFFLRRCVSFLCVCVGVVGAAPLFCAAVFFASRFFLRRVFFCVAFFFALRFFLRCVFFCVAFFFASRFFLRRVWWWQWRRHGGGRGARGGGRAVRGARGGERAEGGPWATGGRAVWVWLTGRPRCV